MKRTTNLWATGVCIYKKSVRTKVCAANGTVVYATEAVTRTHKRIFSSSKQFFPPNNSFLQTILSSKQFFPPPNNSLLLQTLYHTLILLSQYCSTSTMASQDDISLLSDFTEHTQDSANTSYLLQSEASTTGSDNNLLRKRQKANKELWSHTRDAKGSEAVRNKHRQQIYYCKHCTSYGGTPNADRFRTHLITHGINVGSAPSGPTKTAFDNTIADIFGKKLTLKDRNLVEEQALQAAIKVPEFKEACARLIAIRNLPFSLLDWPEFWAVILSVNSMAKETLRLARQDVPKLIESTYNLHHKALFQKLQNSLSLVHYSVDMWTSPANTGFQAIVVHWVDAETRCVENVLLSLKEFKGSHGGEEQAEVFLQVIKEAGLQGQLGFFTSDNHGSNDIMMRHIAEDDEIENFDPVLHRVRCFGHSLNLVAQAFLFGSTAKRGEGHKNEDDAIEIAIKDVVQLQDELRQGSRSKQDVAKEFRKHGSLGKLHNCNVFYRSSPSRYQAFVAAVGRAIPMDNDTRWNSWLDEVTVALQKRKEFT